MHSHCQTLLDSWAAAGAGGDPPCWAVTGQRMKLKLFSKPDGLLKPEYKDLLLFKHFSVVKKIGSGSFANV